MSEPSVGPEYQAGKVIQLQILEGSSGSLAMRGKNISVIVERVITETMSPVMQVRFHDRLAILKVYDRRCGTYLRECHDKHIPCTVQVEAAYQSFLNSGAMGPFLEEMDHDEVTSEFPRTSAEIRQGPDGIARFEAALWRITDRHFRTEAEVYERLKDLQGVLIPELYALVRVVPTSASPKQDYQTVYGILLQHIPGVNLDDIIEEGNPARPTTQKGWTSLIQQAIDATYEINKRGVILYDSAPRNVVVEASTFQPFIVDFAQCFFKDKLIQEAVDSGVAGQGWDGDAEFCETAERFDNCSAVGRSIVRRLRDSFGFTVEVRYPKAGELLRDIKRQRKPEAKINEALQRVGGSQELGTSHHEMDEPLHGMAVVAGKQL
ncbi:serine threonine kinase fnkB [Fusarium tjaetaba]|uniref:Serine threonine kinase fnkB n=1 Tax=Fusarium tjaetaba TaxID=1567544 RepID=A0A8H5RG15_9HYPO|nr:serine threonine kinase fnkB [Fusarium tjaetaba]KAF5632438.1 serine threonine kinase fnkB [Fusarium tjaetaba]